MSNIGSKIISKASNAASKVGGIKGKLAAAALKNSGVKKIIERKIKIYIYGAIAAFLLVACVILLLESIFGNSSEAASYKISSPEFKAKVDPKAMEIYDKYGSCIGFTLDQVEEVVKEATKAIEGNNDAYVAYTSKKGMLTEDKKAKISDLVKEAYDGNGNLKSEISSGNATYLNFYKTSKDGKFPNIISIEDNISMYSHVLRTEKYQFNNIKWMAYTHGGGASEIEKDGFTYNADIGLVYPTAGNPNVYDFMNMVSPYLMSSTIPSAYFSQSLYSQQNRTSMGYSKTDEYYASEMGITSNVGDFAYEVIKHGKSAITVNQYNLQSQTVTSSWEEYDDYTTCDRFKIIAEESVGKYYDSNGNYVEGHDEVQSTKYRVVIDSYVDGLDNHTESNKGEHHNSRFNKTTNKIENKLEKVENKPSPTVSIKYKLSNATAFDVNVTNSYDYKTYKDDDVNDLINANVETGGTPEEIKRPSESTKGNHYTIEQLQNMSQSELEAIVKNSSMATAGNAVPKSSYTQTTWDDGTSWKIHVSEREYSIKGNDYTLEYGNKNFVTRTWSDTISQDPTSTKKTKLGVSNLVEFNKNNDKDFSKDTIKADDFKADSDSVAYYTNLSKQEGTALNNVDILDSNKKIFLNYLSGANARYAYAGYTRNEYSVSKGNAIITSEFTKLADKNNGALPFEYGESFGFDTGAEEPSNSLGSSGKRAMYEYIYQLEGTGTMKEENGIKYYQVYTINGNRTVGHGLDLETSGKEGDLIELARRAGYDISTAKDSWIPADIVDAILDQEIEHWYSVVVSKTSGLNLKEYQIFALTSRAINCGYNVYLPYKSSPANGSIDLITAVNTYWHPETDDKYETLNEKYGGSDVTSEQENDIYANVDYNHGLFSSYLAGPNNGGQLDNRRKSEWVLFQTGYYGYNTNIKSFYSESGGSIVECAEYVHAYMEENNYAYCVYGSNSYEECGKFGKAHGLDATFEESKTNHQNTCCATFVSWALQEAGYMTAEEHTKNYCNGAENLYHFLENKKGWTRVDANSMEAGDVMCFDGHIEIYAGDNTTYNAGSGSAIRGDAPAKKWKQPLYALRAPN